MSDSEVVKVTAYLKRAEYIALRQRLLTQGISFSEWVRQQIRSEIAALEGRR